MKMQFLSAFHNITKIAKFLQKIMVVLHDLYIFQILFWKGITVTIFIVGYV